jgi:hypothetical protein
VQRARGGEAHSEIGLGQGANEGGKNGWLRRIVNVI